MLSISVAKLEGGRRPSQSNFRARVFTDEAPLIYRDKRAGKGDKTAQSSGIRGCILYFYIRKWRFKGTLGNALTY